jgi:hypothetical protein
MEEHLTILHELNLSLSEQVIPELCGLMVSVASFDKLQDFHKFAACNFNGAIIYRKFISFKKKLCSLVN